MLSENNIGKRIKLFRNKSKLTCEAFSEMVNISTSFLKELERGTKKPSIETFIRIANVLNVSSDELLCDEINSAKNIKLNGIAKKLEGISKEKADVIEKVIDSLIDNL